jgi:hypothetical protein
LEQRVQAQIAAVKALLKLQKGGDEIIALLILGPGGDRKNRSPVVCIQAALFAFATGFANAIVGFVLSSKTVCSL